MLFNYLYKQTNHYANSQFFNNQIKNMHEGTEFVVLGSGPGFYDIDLSMIPVQGAILSRPPQSFKYDFRLLKANINKINEGAIVVVVVCLLGFGYNRAYYEKGYNYRYADVLTIDEIEVIDEGYIRRRNYFPLWYSPKSVIRIIKDVQPMSANKWNDKQEIDWKIDAKNTYENWLAGALLNNLSDESQANADRQQQAFAEKIQILSDELTFMREHKLRPVIVIPPFSAEVAEYISDSFKTVFVDKNLNRANVVNAPVLDYWKDERFGHDEFMSSCFMNSVGARKFTEILWKDIYSFY